MPDDRYMDDAAAAAYYDNPEHRQLAGPGRKRTLTAAQKILTDAIVLERAERILRRVYPDGVATDATLYAVVSFLKYQAQAWRQEAEDYDGESHLDGPGDTGSGPEEADQHSAEQQGEGGDSG